MCRKPECSTCSSQPEFVTVHYECYELFERNCRRPEADLLMQLWFLATCKRPWRGSWPVWLHTHASGLDADALAKTAELVGLPQLSRLPAELLDTIHDLSRDSLFWKCVWALWLAADVSPDPGPPHTIPLRDVLAWEAGGDLERAPAPSCVPVRLTIHPQGISKVERIADRPPYDVDLRTCSAYAFIDAQNIDGIMVQLQNGHLRLEVRCSMRKMLVWNTPTPPCVPRRAYLQQPTNIFHAVEADSIQGMTFIYTDGGRLAAVYFHHAEDSCADTLDQTLRGFSHVHFVWIYLPIPKGDRLLAFGVRQITGREIKDEKTLIFARTQRGGDAIIGPQLPEPMQDEPVFTARSAPVTLLVEEPNIGGDPAPFFDAYSRLDPYSPMPFVLDRPRGTPHSPPVFYSQAPLEEVVSTLTFDYPVSGACAGILFRYRNGAVRTVGECRLHVHPTEEVVEPQSLCFRNPVSAWNGLIVQFQHVPKHDDTEEWECHPLKGVLRFFFDSIRATLQVVP